MSDVFTPLESIPLWAQKIDLVNPMACIMRVNRMIMLKGSGFSDLKFDLQALVLIAMAFTTLGEYYNPD
jgi:ABC-2 type transport system permease protein